MHNRVIIGCAACGSGTIWHDGTGLLNPDRLRLPLSPLRNWAAHALFCRAVRGSSMVPGVKVLVRKLNVPFPVGQQDVVAAGAKVVMQRLALSPAGFIPGVGRQAFHSEQAIDRARSKCDRNLLAK